MSTVKHPARLIPVSGIGNTTEAERRAASAFLAVLSIVRDLSIALLGHTNAPRAKKAEVETYAEVQFTTKGKTDRPDGLIEVAYGTRTWTALVEVKTKSDRLRAEQVNRYWNLAKAKKYNHVLTISNEIAPAPGEHPTSGLRFNKASSVQISHLSWSEILLTAIRIREHTPVEDREQAWLLNELIRYLEHPASGVLAFDDMGQAWVRVRDAARARNLSRRTDGVADVVNRWNRLIRFAGLSLSSEVGENVKTRFDNEREQIATLCERGVLEATLHVPKTAGDMHVQADLRAGQIVAAMTVRAPEDKGSTGRISWLVRQIKDVTPGLSIESYPKNSQIPTIASLGAVREDRSALLGDKRRQPHRFRLVSRKKMGAGRKAGPASKSFIGSVLGGIEDFYEKVVQEIDEWRPPVPQRKPIPEAKDSTV